MARVFRKHLVEGVDIPGIIRNGSYFFSRFAVYEDGAVSCWHRSDLEEFRKDLESGWAAARIPDGECLDIFQLGSFPVREAQWEYDKHSYYRHVREIVKELNPEMENLYRSTEHKKKLWDQHRVSWSGSPTYCRLAEGLGYRLKEGKNSHIFLKKEDGIYLTTLIAYEDKKLAIDEMEDKLFSLEEIRELFQNGTLLTAPEPGTPVTVTGLGRLLFGESRYAAVSAEEKYKEIEEMAAEAAEEETAHDRCMNAYYQYLVNPEDWEREQLRKAYEAVPEHERMYLGDMDSRDSDFIRILYHPEEKREV